LLAREGQDPRTTPNRVYAATRGRSFDFMAWEVDALWSKLRQELWGMHDYLPLEAQKRAVLGYLQTQGTLWRVEASLASTPTEQRPALSAERASLRAKLHREQALAEHLIERQVSAILAEDGFAVLGQVLPPVTMRFLGVPDLVVVSPRESIRQEFTHTLKPLPLDERLQLEAEIAAALPDKAVWLTPIGGVGLYPSMVMATDSAVIAFEITAHEWVHHYLLAFPLGLEYFAHPDTRLINETVATLIGDEVGNAVIQRFYAEELARGEVYLQPLPDYRLLLADLTASAPRPALVDGLRPAPFQISAESWLTTSQASAAFLRHAGHAAAAQTILDLRAAQGASLGYAPPADPNSLRPSTDGVGWISQTRRLADYLLGLGYVAGAEWGMEVGRQHAGLRVLNQAWFAFNTGYQANPTLERSPSGALTLSTTGGGGDPLGAALYELRARAGSRRAFLEWVRGLTRREEVFALLERLRAQD
jgi:hypothetical protein